MTNVHSPSTLNLVTATATVMQAHIVEETEENQEEEQLSPMVEDSAAMPTERAVVIAEENKWWQNTVRIPLSTLLLGFGTMLIINITLIGTLIWSLIGGSDNKIVPQTSPTSAPDVLGNMTMLETIRGRGALRCGMRERRGLSLDGQGSEADLCRAIAAGVLGPDYEIELQYIKSSERFRFLVDRKFDVLPGLVTHNMEREVSEKSTGQGFSFSVPYLYNGLSFGGVPEFVHCAESLNITGPVCSNLDICVLVGTNLKILDELFSGRGFFVSEQTQDQITKFIDGTCNVIAAEQFDVAEVLVREAGYTGNYTVGKQAFSREPIAIMTRQEDPEFTDQVNWILQALMTAEEHGITQGSASLFPQSKFYGDSFANVISAVGNYGEMYERHLQNLVPRSTVNTVNRGTTGLIFTHPLGDVNVNGGLQPSPTLEAIRNRGTIRCGISLAPGFAQLEAGGQWSGLDVDLCRALSAAIFSGSPSNVLLVDLPSSERFRALENEQVDVLAAVVTRNMERDVREPSIDKGVAFSPPYFYDGMTFAGLAEFVECAENVNTTCSGLQFCVESSVTFHQLIQSLFGSQAVIKDYATLEVVALAFGRGECNVVAGGSLDVQAVPDLAGYSGPYVVGTGRFSKDPISMVTREDDPQWTSFVNWVLSATMYSEEQGIDQSTANSDLPTVFLFGPLFTRFFRNAIQAVGNYFEVYERNMEEIVPRGGLNRLNNNPLLGPQFYPYPGFGFE